MIIRLLDVIGALVGIVVSAPVMVVAALAVRIDSKGPIIFVQSRIGKDNAIFRIYKLRTMYVGTPEIAKGNLASQIDSRVTKVGRILRRTSIDELPQLFNVLKGEMSLVGPRPALYNQYDLIEMRTSAGVHRLRPGLTGLAQVMGREDMGLEQKVQFDKELLGKLNPLLYMSIVLKTVRILFSNKGTY